jgi:nucleoside-diphosphate-sugar epimerase
VNGFEVIYKKGKHLNIYNIGNDKQTSIKNLVKLICKKIKIKEKIGYKKKFLGSPRKRCPDISKIKKLGFVPLVDIKKGIDILMQNYEK